MSEHAMRDIAIHFDAVSKRYRLRRGWSFKSAREAAAGLTRRLLTGARSGRDDTFWALRDVSFEVGRGETVGLIGPNGAGKSTILKILSRVTVPTKGTFTIRGKVGALIEIGAGFHPELTGRENVYLNGAIMGMTRREIDAKFERIVAFAEIDQFIDTPIKHYSSGMSVRLGFAVAAHTDPEILLVDEVLAVGDASFQAKCLNKLAELKEQERTIILVSHNMANLLRHSNRVLWIDHGSVRAFGDPDRIVEEYLLSVQGHDPSGPSQTGVIADSPIRVSGVGVSDGRSRGEAALQHGDRAVIEVAYERVGAAQHSLLDDPVILVSFHDVRGSLLGGLTTRLDGIKIPASEPRGVVRLVLDPVLFTRGAYTITVGIQDERIQRYLDLRPRAATFTVEGPSVSSREVSGHVVYPHRWEVER
jgi:ABC-type polysaccharide/polyol phosphate transport system ATPase subunit